MSNKLVKNADGDEFCIYYDAECRDWRGEQFTGLSKNYLHLPAMLSEKSKAALIREIRQHRSA